MYSQGCDYTPDPDPDYRSSHCGLLDPFLTIDEVNAMPTIDVKVVFHFIADDLDRNFTCDPNDPLLASQPNLYIPDIVPSLLSEMNLRYSDQQIIQGIPGNDSRVRISLLNGTDPCNNSFFYTNGTNWWNTNDIPGALDIIITDRNTTTTGAYAGGRVVMYNFLNQIFTLNTWPHWESARVTNHEIGHSFGLSHTMFCDNPCGGEDFANDPLLEFDPECECTPDCSACTTGQGAGDSNICTWGISQHMMAYGTSLTITQCEHKELWSNAINVFWDFRDFCNNQSLIEELVYDTGLTHTWEGIRLCNADIRIKSGTEVVIECDLFMGSGKKIYVERGGTLNIDGGHILGLCGNEWKGIIVEGNGVDQGSTAGRVIIDGGTIENAKRGITTRPRRSWDSNFWGGLVDVDDATFINCDIGIEFYRYDGEQESSINNSTFSNLNRGVTIWANDVIPITETTFSNIGDRGIMTWDASVSVTNNCDFNNCTNFGIQLHHTFQPMIPSRIGDTDPHNTFDDCGIAIQSTGAAGIENRLLIENNSFINNSEGVFLDGENDFNFYNNHCDGNLFGFNTLGTGGSDNLAVDNEFNNSIFGVLSRDQNDNYRFLSNCFSNPTARDMVLLGTVADAQGSNGEAASNCFSTNAISDLTAVNTNTFNYFTPMAPNADDCLTPVFQGTFNLAPLSATANFANCGLSNATGGGGNNNGTVIDDSCFGVLGQYSISYVINLLSTLNTELYQSTENSIEERIDQEELERCKSQLIRYIVRWYHNQNQFDHIFNILSQQQEFRYKSRAFAVRMHTQEYDLARNYLNTLIANTTGELDYIRTQELNLERLERSNENDISESELTELRTIAEKTHPYHAYAHSLLNILTGEDIVYNKPDLSEFDQVQGRSSDKGELHIYPNPFNDRVIVESKGKSYLLGKTIRVVDYLGNTIFRQILSSHHESIDLSAYAQGVYILLIEDESRVFKQEILFKIK